MRLAETVTFGGSALERAAERRGDERAQETMWADPSARVLLVWRGKLPVLGETGERLIWLATDDPLVAQASERIFLGLDDGAPRFATTLSGWEPEGFDAEAAKAFFDPNVYPHPGLPEGNRFAELRGVMTALSPRDAELAVTAKALFNWHATHRFCARCGAESAMAMAGWQRGCPDCGGQHFPRTDPVVIMLITHGNAVLVGRSQGWPEGMYSLLAGFVEPGETLEAAVRREVAEETGVRVGAVDYLASQPWPFPNSLMFGCRGEALTTDITIDPAEIEDARWVEREEMVRVFAGEHPELRRPRNGAIAHFLMLNWLADRLD